MNISFFFVFGDKLLMFGALLAGPENLAALTEWLQENNLKYVLPQYLYPSQAIPATYAHVDRAIVSEFGGANNQNCFDVSQSLAVHSRF